MCASGWAASRVPIPVSRTLIWAASMPTVAASGPGEPVVNTWRYQLDPAAAGTDVTESFELPGSLPFRLY